MESYYRNDGGAGIGLSALDIGRLFPACENAAASVARTWNRKDDSGRSGKTRQVVPFPLRVALLSSALTFLRVFLGMRGKTSSLPLPFRLFSISNLLVVKSTIRLLNNIAIVQLSLPAACLQSHAGLVLETQ